MSDAGPARYQHHNEFEERVLSDRHTGVRPAHHRLD